jgi:hypothetical protein
MPGNSFEISRQNDANALRYRAAADRYYGIVGLGRKSELLIVAISVGLALSAAANQTLQYDSAFWGLVLTVLDASIVYYVILAKRHAAAQLADCFDRYLFSGAHFEDIPCAPSIDSLTTECERYLARRGIRDRLTDWYSEQLGQLPPRLAHLAALRINAFWDCWLRGTYIGMVISIGVGIVVIALYLFSKGGIRLDRLVTNVLVPLAPAVLWFSRELVEQIDALIRKNEFKRCAEALWRSATRGSTALVAMQIDYLQGLLFAYRRSDVSVPGWLYRLTRRRLQRAMESLVRSLINSQTPARPR